MSKGPSHQLQSRRAYRGERSGKLLAKWLNKSEPAHKFKWLMNPSSGHALVVGLVIDAQVVFRQFAKYKSAGQFSVARRSKKLSPEFIASYDRVNEILANFTHAPQVDSNGVFEGRFVSWMLTEDSPIAHVSAQVRWLLEVIDEGGILRIRRCQQCDRWLFARFSHQVFCKKSCQYKDFSKTSAFRKKRAEYMRNYRQS